MSSGLRSQTDIMLDDVLEEWKALWRDRCDDRVRAEAVASKDFSLLCIERGTVIVASRAFKPLDLRSILRGREADHSKNAVPAYPSLGGWGKFVRTVLSKQSRVGVGKRSVQKRSRKNALQMKKGGRGWLHRRHSE